MKKNYAYIIIMVIVILIGIILAQAWRKKPRTFDERITLDYRDKIPYGTAAAHSLLPSLFPKVSCYYDRRSPGNWDSLSSFKGDQAVILISRNFNADEVELNRLLYFAQQGNYVFIVAKSFSLDAIRFFNFSYNEYELSELSGLNDDSLWLKLERPAYAPVKNYIYPGRKYESTFYTLDTAHTMVLGRNRDNKPDFIEFKSGNGAIFIHTAPLAFSNYFVLHKQNIQYFQEVLSVIPSKVNKILWNDYYLTKPSSRGDKDPDWLSVLFRYPAFKWGLLTVFFLLLVNVILGMRRRQRMIPAYTKPKNDSLDFVKTLGRLYYDRQDHHNLARKMSIYFLDRIRSQYKLAAGQPEEEFILSLHNKSGYPVNDLKKIVSFINYLDEVPFISEDELAQFHQHLELFYQNT